VSSEPNTLVPPRSASARSEAVLRFLQLSARLLVEYNVDSKSIERIVDRIARHAGVDAQALVGYREVTIVAGERSLHARAPEIRINVAVSAGARHIIDEFCEGRVGLDEATAQLETVESKAPRHNRWLVAVLFGLAASAIAWLLRADWGAVGTSAVSAAVALIVRQEIGRRSAPVLFVSPFAGGLTGAVISSLAIRLVWTTTPGLCLIVPALMLVPGPHLINSTRDMLENQMQAAAGRLGLAMGILMSTALGVILGAWLILGPATLPTSPSEAMRLTLPLDMALAGVAACGFGAFYNAPWRVLWVSIVCGMLGHGLRYLSLDHFGIALSTLFACLAIGLIANAAARRLHLPFSAVAFAGAVPMMPGVFMYQSIAGAMRLSAAGTATEPALAAATLALASKSVFVVGAMVIGLLAGALVVNVADDYRMSDG
jgi:uncharacterized membrane protein YjjP (DUF1212 family)